MAASTTPLTTSRVVSHSPVYYGWVIWAVATLGCIATAPAQNFTTSLFIDGLIADLGLDRAVISGLYGLGTFIGALSLTWVGKQIDRRGNRIIGVVVAGLYAAALVMMAFVSGPLMLLALFTALRGLGQGSLWLVHNTAISRWFMLRRGRVLAITLILFALFQSVYVPWMQQLIVTLGWRTVWLLLGVAVGATIIPLTWLFIRDAPERYGLKPDGGSAWWAARAVSLTSEEDNWTLREAMGTAIFWVFISGRFISPMLGSGLIFHQISVFGAVGHSPEVAAQTYSWISIITALVTVAAGYMVERSRPGVLMALQMAAMAATALLAASMTETWMLPLYALAFGTLIGQAGMFDAAVWADMYGRASQGAIRGFVATVGVAGTAVGPVLFGLSYDLLGHYAPALIAGAALSLIPGVLSLFMRAPVHTAEAARPDSIQEFVTNHVGA